MYLPGQSCDDSSFESPSFSRTVATEGAEGVSLPCILLRWYRQCRWVIICFDLQLVYSDPANGSVHCRQKATRSQYDNSSTVTDGSKQEPSVQTTLFSPLTKKMRSGMFFLHTVNNTELDTRKWSYDLLFDTRLYTKHRLGTPVLWINKMCTVCQLRDLTVAAINSIEGMPKNCW
jgi:hypothetical protein